MYIIGIAGGSGSGKTTFADKVLALLNEDVALLHMDSYYLDNPPSKLLFDGKANFDHPDAFDWDLLRSHLSTLKQNDAVKSPIYDFKSSKRTSNVRTIEPTKVILFEGIFTLFDSQIRDLLDIKVFLNVEADIRFIRRLNRDVKERGRSLESVINQYYQTVRPMYENYLAPQRQYADFIIGEETDIAASILASKIKELLYRNEYRPLVTSQDRRHSFPDKSELNLQNE